MISKATYLILLTTAISIAGTDYLHARQTLGVAWEISENEPETRIQLEKFSELGINVLELRHPVSRETVSLLSAYDFNILVRSSEEFYTLSEIRRQHQHLSERYLKLVNTYSTNFQIPAIGLLSNSQIYRQAYMTEFSPVVDTLALHSNKTFYFVQGGEWFYFRNPLQAFARSISGPDFRDQDLIALDAHLSDSVFSNPEIILFMHSSWLLDGIEAYPELQNSLVEYQESGEWLLPLPFISASSYSANWPVLLLLALWAGLAVQLRLLPVSGAMIFRYFLAHRFFADDILHYRERSSAAGITIMTLHAFFGGMVLYLLAHAYISEIGLEAFYDHLPGLAITGRNYISFFFLGVIFLLLMQFLALIWLYFPNQSLDHFSQAINLYSGVFYIDFILVTVMLTLVLSGAANAAILVCAILFLLFWFSAFYIAAGDASKYMGPGKVIYLLLTVGLHTAATAALIILLLNSNDLLEVIDLAVSITN
ncbi:MAG: hypothetical protein WD059_02015 [Balneolaceae bacterium]